VEYLEVSTIHRSLLFLSACVEKKHVLAVENVLVHQKTKMAAEAASRVNMLLIFLHRLAISSMCFKLKTNQKLDNISRCTAATSYNNYSIKERCLHRVKLPIVKSSKHGTVVLQLCETHFITRFVSKEPIIQSGDVLPLPGPNNRPRVYHF